MSRVSPEDILNMKQSYNLAEVVQESHKLRHGSGDEYIGTCPFHNEDTPSFRVNKQRFHCFGCGIHGDIISWVTRTRGVSFQQAIAGLIKKDLPSGSTRLIYQRKVKNYSDYDAVGALEVRETNEEAALTFQEIKNPDRTASVYIKKRFTKEQIETFLITYHGNSQDDFIDNLTNEGFNKSELLDAGLIGVDSRGGYYPRLRDRVIFPLTNKSGYFLGFAGRKIPRKTNESWPKYINPPDTKAYNKKAYLYGWPTFDSNNKTAFIVEGYMDVLGLHKCGISNVFAVGTTSISTEQINTLETYFKTVYVMFDGDLPGLNGAAKSAEKLIHASFDTKFILLTDGQDPDSLSEKGDKAVFKTFPVVKITDFFSNTIMSKEIKRQEYDTSTLDTLSAPYVLDNIKQGFPQYNVVDWCMQAYPQYAKAIKEATLKMVNDVEELSDGTKKLKEENVRAFLREWIKPCREVRKKHEQNN